MGIKNLVGVPYSAVTTERDLSRKVGVLAIFCGRHSAIAPVGREGVGTHLRLNSEPPTIEWAPREGDLPFRQKATCYSRWPFLLLCDVRRHHRTNLPRFVVTQVGR